MSTGIRQKLQELRRYRKSGIAAVLLLLFAFIAVLLLVPDRENGVSKKSFDAIKEGMSRSEIYSVLGCPGDYTTGPTSDKTTMEVAIRTWHIDGSWTDETIAYDEWRGNDAIISIAFDRSGIVIHKTLRGNMRLPSGPIDYCRWWMRKRAKE
jgi:hypothetical protein